MGEISNHENNFSELPAQERTISVTELNAILNQYKPQTWFRLFARFGLGWIFDSFSYSQPVYQLKVLCQNKKDGELVTENEVKEALQKSSCFDVKHEERTKNLNNYDFFKNHSRKEDKLDTDGVIRAVLSKFQ
ncbi:MAG: hypothetical protein QG556_70 [Pseudomonadota bacterium]|nr:hypothetical protein [Pseudomonadota bacterium]